MNYDDLPNRWKKLLSEWIRAKTNDDRDNLLAGDFPSTSRLKLDFEDGSTAAFEYAIDIECAACGELGVFTEHCGYHIYALAGLAYERIDKKDD